MSYNIYFPNETIEKKMASSSTYMYFVSINRDLTANFTIKVKRTAENRSETTVPDKIRISTEPINIIYEDGTNIVLTSSSSTDNNWKIENVYAEYSSVKKALRHYKWTGITTFDIKYKPIQQSITDKTKFLKLAIKAPIAIEYDGLLIVTTKFHDDWNTCEGTNLSSADECFNSKILSPNKKDIYRPVKLNNIHSTSGPYFIDINRPVILDDTGTTGYTDSQLYLLTPFKTDTYGAEVLNRKIPSWWGVETKITTIDSGYSFGNKKNMTSFKFNDNELVSNWGNYEPKECGYRFIVYDPIKQGCWITDKYTEDSYGYCIANWAAELNGSRIAKFYPTKTIGIDVCGAGAGAYSSTAGSGGGGAYFRAILNMEGLEQVCIAGGHSIQENYMSGFGTILVTRSIYDKYYFVNDYGHTENGGEIYPKTTYSIGINRTKYLTDDKEKGQIFYTPYTTHPYADLSTIYTPKCWIAHGGTFAQGGLLSYCEEAIKIVEKEAQRYWKVTTCTDDELLTRYWDDPEASGAPENLNYIAFLNRYNGKDGTTSAGGDGNSFIQSDCIYSMNLINEIPVINNDTKYPRGKGGKGDSKYQMGGGASAIGNGVTYGDSNSNLNYGGGGAYGAYGSIYKNGKDGCIIIHTGTNEGVDYN